MADEKKGRYTPAQNKATQKYMKEHLDDIRIRVPKGKKDYYKTAAENANQSLNQFVVSSMDERIQRDGLMPDEADQ